MVSNWFQVDTDAIVVVVVNAVGIYLAVIVFTRIAGLRSFAKMSSFDFAMTVAIGSLIATTIVSPAVSLLNGIVGAGMIYLLQVLVGVARVLAPGTGEVIDNAPMLLMAGPHVIEGNLDRGQVTLEDLRSKLREANVIHPSQLRAVVLETTGDVSVLHAGPDDPPLDIGLLDGVIGVELLAELSVVEVDDASRSLWQGPGG